jgi:hypothetical protein
MNGILVLTFICGHVTKLNKSQGQHQFILPNTFTHTTADHTMFALGTLKFMAQTVSLSTSYSGSYCNYVYFKHS